MSAPAKPVRVLRAPVGDPRAELVIFPHAGSHPGGYHHLAARLPGCVAVRVVAWRPGPVSFAAVVEQLASEVPGVPRLLAGHSLGGLIAWQVAAELTTSAPVAGICVSGVAPVDAGQWQRMATLAALGDAELRDHLTAIGAVSDAVLQEPSLLAYYIDAFRSDLHLAVSQVPRELLATSIPVLTLCGRDDRQAPCEGVRRWSVLAPDHRHVSIPGSHDFFYCAPATAVALAGSLMRPVGVLC